MEREALMEKTIHKLEKMPIGRIREVSDIVELMSQRVEDAIIVEGIKDMAFNSKAFDFLKDEPDLYTLNDLKVRFR